KYSLTPCSGTRDGTFSADGTMNRRHSGPNYLREDLRGRLGSGDVCFELKVQLRTVPAQMPVERPTVEWDEKVSVPVPVARLVISKQDTSAERATRIETLCDGLRFNPWHARMEHRPLGNMSRARKVVYLASADNRGGNPEPVKSDLNAAE